jgi:FAD/FMN-containing dehydrogenase
MGLSVSVGILNLVQLSSIQFHSRLNFAMASSNELAGFKQAHPDINVLLPGDDGFPERQKAIAVVANNKKPLGIIIPKSAQQVSDAVIWTTRAGLELVVRSGGNDFYGRSMVDGGVVIDMRDMNSLVISEDRKTVTIGGGIITKDLVQRLDKEGLVVPIGNWLGVGYVGWATHGGYGPLQGPCGMGWEGIVSAEVVCPRGRIVPAADDNGIPASADAIEGLRGMGGNLFIVTALTIKAYPSHQVSLCNLNHGDRFGDRG